ncbi:hypothetical protein STSP2_03080 [Anaerohalosphaera lusitana]|uniref:Uncharacterized protein n=1 Tax=Anaerohalosphaera lusitana TaxID=1936003 RepID=A0A1U9NQI7_9BACT|nr:hypothetical protein [Anaerohalosphaera lusitana]AQT69880.1 hypothetical protein STSP2_03080 [Anaerohalosphaera lusitana]
MTASSKSRMSLEQYLEKVARFVGDEYGRQVRRQFGDNRGSGELGMLESPSHEELEQIRRAVAIMTPEEKANATSLTDEQVERIAQDAKVDEAVFAIFINGYSLECKRVS